MPKMSTNANHYFVEGCGRCKHGGTPQCKIHTWHEQLPRLRALVLDSGLVEESKWGMPCYTYNNKNVVMIAAFKDYCALSFFKGVLLKDPHGLLVQQGENTQTARLAKLTLDSDMDQILPLLKAYLQEAIDLEKAGVQVPKKAPQTLELPEELVRVLDEDPAYKDAFEALTPGRKRSYVMHFSQPKKVETRFARIEKCRDRIFDGMGLNEY